MRASAAVTENLGSIDFELQFIDVLDARRISASLEQIFYQPMDRHELVPRRRSCGNGTGRVGVVFDDDLLRDGIARQVAEANEYRELVPALADEPDDLLETVAGGGRETRLGHYLDEIEALPGKVVFGIVLVDDRGTAPVIRELPTYPATDTEVVRCILEIARGDLYPVVRALAVVDLDGYGARGRVCDVKVNPPESVVVAKVQGIDQVQKIERLPGDCGFVGVARPCVGVAVVKDDRMEIGDGLDLCPVVERESGPALDERACAVLLEGDPDNVRCVIVRALGDVAWSPEVEHGRTACIVLQGLVAIAVYVICILDEVHWPVVELVSVGMDVLEDAPAGTHVQILYADNIYSSRCFPVGEVEGQILGPVDDLAPVCRGVIGDKFDPGQIGHRAKGMSGLEGAHMVEGLHVPVALDGQCPRTALPDRAGTVDDAADDDGPFVGQGQALEAELHSEPDEIGRIEEPVLGPLVVEVAVRVQELHLERARIEYVQGLRFDALTDALDGPIGQVGREQELEPDEIVEILVGIVGEPGQDKRSPIVPRRIRRGRDDGVLDTDAAGEDTDRIAAREKRRRVASNPDSCAGPADYHPGELLEGLDLSDNGRGLARLSCLLLVSVRYGYRHQSITSPTTSRSLWA